MTATLLAVILAVATDLRASIGAAAVAIGGTIALASLVGGPISGASLEPRAFHRPRARLRGPRFAVDLSHRARCSEASLGALVVRRAAADASPP